MVNQQQYEEMKKISCLALDIDGVLTDGRLYFSAQGNLMRSYSVRDGYGIFSLLKRGFEVAIISAAEGPSVEDRVSHFGVKHIYLGSFDKLQSFNKLMDATNLPAEKIAFMGDDVFDIPVLDACGFSMTVQDCHRSVKSHAKYVLPINGGQGAVRLITDTFHAILDGKSFDQYQKEVMGV